MLLISLKHRICRSFAFGFYAVCSVKCVPIVSFAVDAGSDDAAAAVVFIAVVVVVGVLYLALCRIELLL